MNYKYIIFAIILFIILLIIYKLVSSKPKKITKKITIAKSKNDAIKKLPLDTQSDISLAKTAVHLEEVEVAKNLLNEVDDPELRALLLKSQDKQTKLANNSAINTVKTEKKSIFKSKLDDKAVKTISKKFPNIPKKEILGSLNVAAKITKLAPKTTNAILKTVKKVTKPKIKTLLVPGVAQASVAEAVFNKLKKVKVINKATKKSISKIANLNPKAFNQVINITKTINKKVNLFKPKVFKSETRNAINIAKTISDPRATFYKLLNKNIPVSKTLGLKKSRWPVGKPLPSVPKGIENPNEFIKDPDGQILIDPETGQPITKKDAVKSFAAAHPDQVAKFKTAATKKVVSMAVAGLAKKVVGAALMPKGGFNPKKMAAGLIFLIPGFRKIFMKVFPAPVGPFLEENVQLLYSAVVVLMSPATMPVTLPPFLVQVMIALSIYLIMKNLQKIKDAAKKVGKAVARGATVAGKAVGRGATVAGKAVGRGATVAGKAVGRGATVAGKAVGRGATVAGKAVGRGATVAAKTVGKGIKSAGKAIGKAFKKF